MKYIHTKPFAVKNRPFEDTYKNYQCCKFTVLIYIEKYALPPSKSVFMTAWTARTLCAGKRINDRGRGKWNGTVYSMWKKGTSC